MGAGEEAVSRVSIDDLQLSSFDPLKRGTRPHCPSCGKSRAYFCYDCPRGLLEGTPRLRLPVKVDIVQHGEINAKATGVHAAIIAPEDVRLFRHDSGNGHHRRLPPEGLSLPDYDPATTVVVFPSDDAEVVGDPACRPFERAVLIEGTWKKAGVALKHPKLAGLRRVKLGNVRTVYWRRGEGTFRGVKEEGVCTIEALYFLCMQLASGGAGQQRLQAHPGAPLEIQQGGRVGGFDDLLYFFVWQKTQVEGAEVRKRLRLGEKKEENADGGGGET